MTFAGHIEDMLAALEQSVFAVTGKYPADLAYMRRGIWYHSRKVWEVWNRDTLLFELHVLPYGLEVFSGLVGGEPWAVVHEVDLHRDSEILDRIVMDLLGSEVLLQVEVDWLGVTRWVELPSARNRDLGYRYSSRKFSIRLWQRMKTATLSFDPIISSDTSSD